MAIEKQAFGVARRLARRRSAPALHPDGLVCPGVLDVPGTGTADAAPWGVPFLDRAGRYDAAVRWSRALGLPAGRPDGLGLAVRVDDAGGPGVPLDLLMTSSGTGRLGRHVPLPRRDALAGPYSTLLSYRTGGRERVVAAFPVRTGHRRVPGDPDALRRALDLTPVRLALCAAAPDEPWRPFATLTVRAPRPAAGGTLSARLRPVPPRARRPAPHPPAARPAGRRLQRFAPRAPRDAHRPARTGRA
ncbi:phosphodiesterase [Streptomyces lavendulocolor]|uniref:phosphodiesterase n=1 Tax=Streptomyces lavendulocolor TaxID=67316 RepID=UPI003C2F5F54